MRNENCFPFRKFLGRSRASATVITLACLLLGAALPAQRAASPHKQFVTAETLRTALEKKPAESRTLAEYQQVVAAYRQVYLITPQAEDATQSLMTIGRLYTQMGKQFDPTYFNSAIVSYDFLLHGYLESRFRPEALFHVGEIEFEEMHQLEDAQSSFQSLLKDFPDSPQANEARAELQKIAGAREQERAEQSSAKQRSEDGDEPREIAHVTGVRTSNAKEHTRVVITLDRAVSYESSHIKNPERVFFDLANTRLPREMAGKTYPVDGGFLRAVRVGQYQPSVARLVLDLDGNQGYAAVLLKNPPRLVVDVGDTTGENIAGSMADSAENPGGSADGETAPGRNNSADDTVAPSRTTSTAKPSAARSSHAAPVGEASATRDGQRSLSRALGLKVNRIVIDAGHGGHDTGTIGPHGVMEKNVCLDVALRLGRLIKKKLPGAQIVYTRSDDTFVPLEQRTAIANEAKADIFISVHANSSPNPQARGIETYYLNFATSDEAMQVASRENATSQTSMHDLQDVIKKIARNEKVEESKEFAGDIQDSLSHRMQLVSRSEKDRGVKRAPFVVLVGASMPSVLAEISFLSNPADERLMSKPEQRQRIAEGLYAGMESYLRSLNSVAVNRPRLANDRSEDSLPSHHSVRNPE